MTSERPASARLVLLIVLANTLVWFNVAVFAFFALQLSKAFFPATDETTSLLLTLSSFALSFLVRPLGGLLLGAYADRAGRGRSLILSAVMMSCGSLVIGLMPTFECIGIAAPIGVVVARIVQGFAAGGEFGSATALLATLSEQRKRGAITSWQLASQMMSGALAAGIGMTLSLLLTASQLEQWGWRIPFLLGALLTPISIILRSSLIAAPPEEMYSSPVYEAVRNEYGSVFIACGLVAISSVVTYTLTYLPTYSVRSLGMSGAVGNAAVLFGFLIQIPITLYSGRLSDGVGRARLMAIALVLLMLTAVPVFLLLSRYPTPFMIFFIVGWLALLKSIYAGALVPLLVDWLPNSSRATTLAVSYNMAVALFGSTAPMWIVWIGWHGAPLLAPALYVLAVAVIAALALAVGLHRRPTASTVKVN